MLYLRNLAQKILISNLNNDVLSKLQIPQLKAEPDLNLADYAIISDILA